MDWWSRKSCHAPIGRQSSARRMDCRGLWGGEFLITTGMLLVRKYLFPFFRVVAHIQNAQRYLEISEIALGYISVSRIYWSDKSFTFLNPITTPPCGGLSQTEKVEILGSILRYCMYTLRLTNGSSSRSHLKPRIRILKKESLTKL